VIFLFSFFQMDAWVPAGRYTWGAYPVGPVANNIADQGFLWGSGQRMQSNYDLMDTTRTAGIDVPLTSFAQEFRQTLPVVPQGCMPLKGGCKVPPLAECRSDLRNP
jgi:hypothetical protein